VLAEPQHPSLVHKATSVLKALNLQLNSLVHFPLCFHQRVPPHIPNAHLAPPVSYALRELQQLLIAPLAKTVEQHHGYLATAKVANTHRTALAYRAQLVIFALLAHPMR